MMTFNPTIFREYDVRGIAETELSNEFAYALGRAYATYLADHLKKPTAAGLTVSHGVDCRLTSPRLSENFVRALTDSGIHVVRLGVVPTPVTYFSAFHLKVDGAIMITGSHNPKEYNGFKIGVGKGTLHGEAIQALKKIILDNAFVPLAKSPGKVTDQDISDAYVAEIISRIGKLGPKKIVVDAGNGTAAILGPKILSALGAEVIPLFCEMDGNFPNHHPDPTVPENLTVLIAKIKETMADFGVAFDGDSDRVGVVDEQGTILFGDELMILFAKEILQRKPGATVIAEVKSSFRLFDFVRENGGKAIMWKTGHSLIKSKMKECAAELAGEMSGHIFFQDRYFGFDDAIYAAARFYEIAAKAPGATSTLLAGIPKTVFTPEIRIECVEEKKFPLVARAKELLRGLNLGTVNDLDGIRVDGPKAWGLIRASNTQAVIVMRFEAFTQSDLNEFKSKFESALDTAAKEIGHPPLNF